MVPNGHDAQPDPILELLEETASEPPDPPEPFRMTFEVRVTRALQRLEAGQLRQTAVLRALVPQVRQLQTDSAWKARLAKAAKILAPALVGAVAARFPELGEVIKALGGAVFGP
jgi:hypothetical protein